MFISTKEYKELVNGYSIVGNLGIGCPESIGYFGAEGMVSQINSRASEL
jgi:hypothetical protein